MRLPFGLKIVICFCLLIHPFYLLSQKSPLKWGKISDEEIQLTICEFDSSATAVILSDWGNVDMFYGRPMTISRHQRLKILAPNGNQYADISIPFYAGNNFEKIKQLKAQIITVDESGKTIKQKVEKNQFFENEIDENWSEMKFTFPNVQVGAILEYKYTLISSSVTNLKKWYFQNHIPTLHSEFHGRLQEGLDYNTLLRGSRLIQKYRTATVQNSWSLDNIPAIKVEPHCNNQHDFVDRIEFQLAGYLSTDDMGQSKQINLMSTWEQFTKDVLQFDTYRHYLGKKKTAKNTVPNILEGNENDLDKVKLISEYLGNTIKWNQEYWMYKNQNVSNLIKNKSGNSAKINLFFVSLLRAAGLEAHPALASTKKHGQVSTVYPLRTQFNHVLAAVKLNDTYQLFDATHPRLPFDLLHLESLNGKAFLLKKSKDPLWIDIPNKKKSVESTKVNMEINEDGIATFDIELGATIYKANQMYHDIFKDQNPSVFCEEYLGSNFEEAEILDFKIEKIPIATTTPLKVKTKLQAKEKIDLEADILYIQPFIEAITEHPFKSKKRVFPVDFYYPSQKHYSFTLKIPTGFIVADLPEQINLVLPDRSLSFTYFSKQNGEVIDLVFNFKRNATRVNVTEYSAFRHLFDRYFAQKEALIVLKKKEN